MTSGPEWDYALCGPGDKLNAELRLLLSGTPAGEVREHPWLSFLRPGEVVLMRKPVFPGPPYEFPSDAAAGGPLTAMSVYAPAPGGIVPAVPPGCEVYWGSHGCDHPRGHGPDIPHACDCCDCDSHPDPDSGCVAWPPYYGPGTHFWGADAEALGLPLGRDRAGGADSAAFSLAGLGERLRPVYAGLIALVNDYGRVRRERGTAMRREYRRRQQARRRRFR